jgi:hypothetical protein
MFFEEAYDDSSWIAMVVDSAPVCAKRPAKTYARPQLRVVISHSRKCPDRTWATPRQTNGPNRRAA